MGDTVDDVEDFVEDTVNNDTLDDIQDGIDDVEDAIDTDLNDVVDDVDQQAEDNDVDLSAIDDIEVNVTVQDIIDFILDNQERLLVIRIELNVVEDYELPLGNS